MYSILLWLALILYFAGMVLTAPSVIRRRPSLPSASLAALGTGLVFHASSLITRAIDLHRLPVIDVQSALSFFAFLVTLTFFWHICAIESTSWAFSCCRWFSF